MTASNIALVFGPTLIGSPPMDPQIMAQGMPLVNRACLFMLDNRVEVFGEPAGVTSADTYQQPGPDSYKIEYPEDAGGTFPVVYFLQDSLKYGAFPVSPCMYMHCSFLHNVCTIYCLVL